MRKISFPSLILIHLDSLELYYMEYSSYVTG